MLDGRPDQRTFGVLDAVVRRNGYGRQAQSFEADVVFGSGEGPPLPAVFIRAPLVVSVGAEVDVLADARRRAGAGAPGSRAGVLRSTPSSRRTAGCTACSPRCAWRPRSVPLADEVSPPIVLP